MNESFYKQVIEGTDMAYACHKIVCDDEGLPCDYDFVDINAAFERYTGLKKSKIIGKHVTEVIKNLGDAFSDLLNIYGNIAKNGGRTEIVRFSVPTNRWFKVEVYSPEKNYFVTLFNDVTDEVKKMSDMRKLSEISEQLLQIKGSSIDYQKITDDLLSLSGAKYAAFNLYDDDGSSYNTVALSGDIGSITEIIKRTRLNLLNAKWEHDAVRAEKISGQTTSRFNSIKDLVHEKTPKKIISAIEKISDIGEAIIIKIMLNETMIGDFTLLMQKGIEFSAENICEIYSKQVGMVISRYKMEESIIEGEKKYSFIIENVNDVISVYNLSKDRMMYVSPSVIHLRGYTDEEAMHQSLEETFSPESFALVMSEIDRNLSTLKTRPNSSINVITEVRIRCKTGDYVWAELSSKLQYNKFGEIEIIAVCRNIDDRKAAEKEVQYLSYFDHLTGLYNRRFYEEEVRRIDTERNLPLALIMADINGLKLTNDTFGHLAGDLLLKRVASIIKNECKADGVAARIGGDEFIILLPETDEETAKAIINRISHSIENERVNNILLSVSLGYGIKQTCYEDMNEIYKRSENHMYRQKLSEIASMRSKSIDLIMNSLYEKNNREMLHSKRVSKICETIARQMNFEGYEVNQIRVAGLIHDIGKIGVSNSMLNKIETLNDSEWEELKKHVEIGYRILNFSTEFSEIAESVLEHHERWDGSGYPRGLKGEEISLQARIINVADSFDAMTSERPYKKAMSFEEGIHEIIRCAGTQFDPDISKAFIEIMSASPGMRI